jgi:phosphoglycerate dehydrogenase-like enzyme
LALLLTLVKQIPYCDRVVKSGLWRQRYTIKTGDMAGRTLGILGLGRIGSHLAKLAQPFDMTILGYDPVVSREQASQMGVELVELPYLLKSSDFVSLHLPLNEHTRGLVNRETLGAMKRGAILINTARGAIVESLDVLAEALETGQLSAVGLDVFPCEPPDTSHRIFHDPRCICAPHVVGVTALAMDRIYRSMAYDMVAVLKGVRPTYCVNPEVLR